MGWLSKMIDRFEQAVIGSLLAAMTLLVAGQALLRELFSVSSGWVLELTTLLFAWLILFGMSYGIKKGTHLGVDAFVRLFPERWYRAFAVFAALACVFYAAILLDAGWFGVVVGDGANARGGAMEYVQKLYRFGIELEDLPAPRWVAYLILPVGLVLFAVRSAQALWDIVMGRRGHVIANHEAEELLIEQNITPGVSQDVSRDKSGASGVAKD